MLESSGDIRSPLTTVFADREARDSEVGVPNDNSDLAASLSKIITAVGNFNVQYNFGVISIVLIIMSSDVCTSTDENCKHGSQESWVSGTASATVFAGAIAGQLSMGYLGDLLGRNKAMTITLAIAAVGALGSAIFPFGSAGAIYAIIIVMRFLLGIGLGGIYPLSATKAAEDAAKQSKLEKLNKLKLQNEGENINGNSNSDSAANNNGVDSYAAAKSYFWQTPGAMAPWAVGYFLTFSNTSAQTKWRLLLGLGSIPAAIIAGLSMWESSMNSEQLNTRVSISYRPYAAHGRSSTNSTDHQEGQQGESGTITDREEEGGTGTRSEHKIYQYTSARAASMERLIIGGEDYDARKEVNLWHALGMWKYQKKLIATGGTWFLFDVCFYGVSLFGGQILASLSSGADDDITTDVNVRLTTSKELVALSIGLPATLFTMLLIPHYSTKFIQIIGFGLIALFFVLLGVLQEPLKDDPNALFTVFCFLQFALFSGPNVTSYILPSELYPKSVRSTFNGISAAMGKLGAVVGAYMFGPMADVAGYSFVFYFCAVLAMIGGAVSYYFIPDKKVTPGDETDDEDDALLQAAEDNNHAASDNEVTYGDENQEGAYSNETPKSLSSRVR